MDEDVVGHVRLVRHHTLHPNANKSIFYITSCRNKLHQAEVASSAGRRHINEDSVDLRGNS